MQRDGLLSILIPEEYGGGGHSLRTATVVLEEVHRSGCNAGAAHAQMYTMGSLLHSGSAEQKAEWLPKIASGELRLQAFGVSEPNSGTDTLSLETTATRDGDDFLISGQKMWTSRAMHSDAMLLLARTDSPEPPRDNPRARAKALTLFIVDMRGKVNRGKGMQITPVQTMMNHSTTTIYFDQLRVPAANIIGGEGNGFKTILDAMNAERVLIAAECIGTSSSSGRSSNLCHLHLCQTLPCSDWLMSVAYAGDGRFFIDRATKYANERTVFGRPIGQNQGISFPIAEAYANLVAAALMVNNAADRIDRGMPSGEQANLAKYLAAEASVRLN
jgi:acyl-CoA dehydrogenase